MSTPADYNSVDKLDALIDSYHKETGNSINILNNLY